LKIGQPPSFTYHNDDYVGLFEDPADGVEKEYYRFYWGCALNY